MSDREKPETPLELPPFDTNEFWRRYGSGLPASQSKSIRAHLEKHGAEQHREVEALPSSVVQILLRDIGGKTFLAFLSQDAFFELKRNAFKGFQAIPSLVRHPAVQKRLLHHFEAHRGDLQAVLLLWAYGLPTAPVIEAVRERINSPGTDTTLHLVRQFGIEATLLALAVMSWHDEFDFALQLFQEPKELAEALESLPSEAPQAQSQASNSTDADWQSRALIAEAEIATARKTIEAMQKKVAEAATLRSQITALQTELVKAQNQQKQLVALWEKKLAHTSQNLQVELEEVKRLEDRQGRRLKAVEREKDELETENRRLKKQLRHTQQLVEEERKKLAQYEQRAKASTPTPETGTPKPEAPKKVATKPVKLTPQDEIFEWQADGRKVRVTPRETRRLIDTNDEDSVFALMLALESLAASPRASDTELRHRFLYRMREMAPFYARVLTQTTTRALVDASNVARSQLTKHGKGHLSLLLQMRDELRRLDYWPIIFIADASLRHHIDQGKAFSEMIERGEIIQGDKGVEADEILAREARRTGATVVTNDTRFFHKVSPDFEPPRLSFRVFDGTVIVNEI